MANRVQLGDLGSGVYGLKVSKPSVNVLTATDKDLLFDSTKARTGQIYAGLYPYILKWCQDNEVEVVDATKITDTKVDEKRVDSFIQALEIPFNNMKILQHVKNSKKY